jgi:hypothetical protein
MFTWISNKARAIILAKIKKNIAKAVEFLHRDTYYKYASIWINIWLKDKIKTDFKNWAIENFYLVTQL